MEWRNSTVWMFVCCLSAYLTAQNDTLTLPQIEVSDVALNSNLIAANDGHHQGLSETLNGTPGVYIGSSSLTGLNTLSYRGTGSSRFAVVWNGINLQSTMNGVVDFSLISSRLFHQMKLERGGTSSTRGSGAIGGSLILDSRPGQADFIKFGYSSRSYSSHGFNFGINRQSGDFSISGAASFDLGRNNYSFRNTNVKDQPIQQLEHASSRVLNGLVDIKWKLASKASLRAFAWWMKGKREIPPTLNQGISVAEQQDESLRAGASYSRVGDKLSLQFGSAIATERIHYSDTLAAIDADNFAIQLIEHFKLQKELSHGLAEAHFKYTFQRAKVDAYKNLRPQNHLLNINFKYQLERKKLWFRTISSIRWRSDIDWVWLPSLEAQWRWNTVHTTHLKWSRNFRAPTFNDLYWRPGGNRDLVPEKSWSFDAGHELRFDQHRHSIQIYYYFINDLIQWQPGELFFSSVNLGEVKSFGVEYEGSFQKKWENTVIHLDWSYGLNKAVEERQLTYTPLHQAKVRFKLNWKSWEIQLFNQFVSKRYTTEDHSSHLPAYFISDVSFRKYFFWGKKAVEASFSIQNLTNTNYQTLRNRPLPLRFYSFGVQLYFQ